MHFIDKVLVGYAHHKISTYQFSEAFTECSRSISVQLRNKTLMTRMQAARIRADKENIEKNQRKSAFGDQRNPRANIGQRPD